MATAIFSCWIERRGKLEMKSCSDRLPALSCAHSLCFLLLQLPTCEFSVCIIRSDAVNLPAPGLSDQAPEESGSTTQEQSWSRRRASVV